MAIPPIPPELYKLTLDQLISVGVVGGYSGSVLVWIKKRVKKKWEEKKYGFTPSPKLAKELEEISKQDQYLRLKEVIGDHWSLHLIKLGLQISNLNAEGKRDAVTKINADVYRRYKKRGVRILTLGSTGVIKDVLEYLSSLKMRENLNQEDMGEEFDMILDNWLKITIFQKGQVTKERLKKEIQHHMGLGQKMFFVFAYGSACVSAMIAIAELNNEHKIREKGYMLFLSRMDTDQSGRDVYSWVYQRISEDFNRFTPDLDEPLNLDVSKKGKNIVMKSKPI